MRRCSVCGQVQADQGCHCDCGPRVQAVVQLYELNGSDTGFGRSLGWYGSRKEAEDAARALGHSHWDVEEGVSAVVFPSGEVFLLRQRDPVKLGSHDG